MATLYDLPLEDIVIPHIGKYLSLAEVTALWKCSGYLKDIAERILAQMKVANKDCNELRGQWDVSILQECQRLRKISIHHDDEMSNEVFTKIVSNNPLLEEVSLRGCAEITFRGLDVLADAKNLINLWLIRIACDNKFLEKLSACNPGLKLIYLTCSNWNTSNGFVNFFRSQPKLRHIIIHCGTLKTYTWCKINLSLVLNEIVQYCRELRSFELTHANHDLYRLDVERIFTNCPDIEQIIIPNILTWRKGEKKYWEFYQCTVY